jgi:FMN phosphatase YigB (HAD superfamily)
MTMSFAAVAREALLDSTTISGAYRINNRQLTVNRFNIRCLRRRRRSFYTSIVLLSLSAAFPFLPPCSSGLSIPATTTRKSSSQKYNILRQPFYTTTTHGLLSSSTSDNSAAASAFRSRHKFTTTTTQIFLQSQFIDDPSSSSSSSKEEEADFQTISKWDLMYQEGEKSKQETIAALMKANSRSGINGIGQGVSVGGGVSVDDPATITVPLRSGSSSSTAASELHFQPSQQPIRIVTFDLDNTLWKTGPSIAAANDALNTYLESDPRNLRIPQRIEIIMKQLFQSNPSKYAPPLAQSSSGQRLSSTVTSVTAATVTSQQTTDDNSIKNSISNNDGETATTSAPASTTTSSPVLLTQLRTDAIAYILETENGFSSSEATEFAQQAFNVWTDARHKACVQHLTPGAVETLEKIRNMFKESPSSSSSQSSSPTSMMIGAITDGNSDPRRIDILEKYFDFVINAESVGTSKPDKRVYVEAIRTVISKTTSRRIGDRKDDDSNDINEGNNTPSFRLNELGIDMSDIDNLHGDNDADNTELLEGLIGPYWCHVGDDFLKDVVPAKNLGMRTIWSVGLVKDMLLKQATTSSSRTTSSDENEKNESTTGSMDIGEFMKQVSSQTVVTMGIGADDYLASSLTSEFVDAVADDFEDIGRILLEWNNASMTKSNYGDASSSGRDECEKLASSSGDDFTVNGTESQQPSNELPVATVGSTVAIEGSQNPATAAAVEFVMPRVFRIVRDDCSMDTPAPLKDRDVRTMKDVMSMAQMDKSSGVFAFDPQDVLATKERTKVLMIRIGDTGVEFSRDVFTSMSVNEVLSFSQDNPLTLELSIKDAVNADSFDLF